MWLGNEFNELSAGFLRIYTTTLIYADLDLALSPRVLPAVGTVGTIDGLNADRDAVFYPPHYFLSEKRRLKFKEVHYFDHPKFGAVVGVWPVDPEEPAPES